MSSALRPEMLCRSSMNTTSPSLSRAIWGEEGDGVLRKLGVLHGHAHGGARGGGGAAAYGVDHDESRALGFLQVFVHFGGGTGFLDSEFRKLFPHGGDQAFIVHHIRISFF